MTGYTFGRTWFGETLSPLDLSHSALALPTRGPVYLRLVKTETQARDYARGGYHVSLTRAEAGGCKDTASAVTYKTTACATPIGRSDLQSAWADAARAYLAAANRLGTVAQIKLELQAANALADRAYGLEGVDPPRDPVLVAEPVAALPAFAEPAVTHKAGIGLGVAAAAVFFVGALATGYAFNYRKRGKR